MRVRVRGLSNQKLKEYTSTLIQQGLHRKRRISDATSGTINFSSNDYLSLTSDPRIRKAYQHGFQHYPTGSGSSMVVCGYHATHKALESAFAQALHVDNCILFSSGYAANLSVMGLLAHLNTPLLIDKGVHASVYDGLQLAKASYSRYLHNNVVDLAGKIKQASANTMIVTEGVFSMSGQCAALDEIARLEHDLYVDEAHAFGVLGEQGLGSVVHHQLTQAEVPLRVIPLGKAFAASGAIVAGQELWLDALLQSARPQTYSTAVSPAVAYGLLETLDVLRAADEKRAKLKQLVSYFRSLIKSSSLQWRDSHSPIQQLQLGCSHRALKYAEKLGEKSILCLAMRQPTVNQQETGLRVILNSNHDQEQIDYLFKCLSLINE